MTLDPDRMGGRKAWLALAIGIAFYCYALFQRIAPGVMVDELMREFAVGASIASVLTTIYYYCYALLQIPVGVTVDRFGLRRVMVLAALLAAGGSLIFAHAENLGMAYLGRALVGCGSAYGWIAVLRIVSAWFPAQRFAAISGLAWAVGVIGAVYGNIAVAKAVSLLGFRTIMTYGAALGLMIALLVLLVVRDRRGTSMGEHQPHRLLEGLRAVITNPATWPITVYGSLAATIPWSFAGMWGTPFLAGTYGLDRTTTAELSSSLMLGAAVGSPIMGWISDRITRRKLPMIIGIASSMALLSTVLFGPLLPLWMMHALLALAGFTASAFVLSYAIGKECNHAWATGAAVGVINTALMAICAVSQNLVGLVLDNLWDGQMLNGLRVYSPEVWRSAAWVFTGGQGIALLAALLVRETGCQQRD